MVIQHVRTIIVLVIALAFLAGVAPGLAVDCSDYGATMHWVTNLVSMQGNGGTLRGNLYYVAGWPTLSIVDVTDPRQPVMLGSIDISCNGCGVALVGDHAFVACANGSLAVFDVLDPHAPTLVAAPFAGTWSTDIAIAGDYAFLAGGPEDIAVFDISDPLNPVQVATVLTPGWALKLATAGNLLYVVDSTYNSIDPDLDVYDISNPLAPTLCSTVRVTGEGYDIALAGEWAYLSSSDYGVTVLSLADPTHPTARGSVTTHHSARGMFVDGSLVYVASAAGVDVVDVSDPWDPFVTACQHGFDASVSYDLTVIDHCILLATYTGLHVVDATYFTHAELLGSYTLPARTRNVVVEGQHAYFAIGRAGLHIADLSVPTAPVALATLETPGAANRVAVEDDLAYVADGDAGLVIVDVSDPSAPFMIAAVDTPDSAVAVAIGGDLAVVADLDGGLQIVDVASPVVPKLVGNLAAHTAVHDVAIAGNLAYMLVGGDLAVVDLGDPTVPYAIGWLETPGTSVGIYLRGNFAYVADGFEGLQIIDVSDPTEPHIVATRDLPYFATSVLVVGDDAYVAATFAAMQLIRVADPLAPQLIGYVDTPVSAVGLARLGDVIYIAGESTDLQMAALQCAESVPNLLADFTVVADGATARIGWRLGDPASGGTFRLDARGGDRQWDVPFAREGAGAFTATDTPGTGTVVTYSLWYGSAAGGWSLVAERAVTLAALPAAARLVSLHPNPFNPRTSVELMLAQTSRARLAVYDLAGREVAILVDDVLAAGAHTATWDGRDGRGHAVASGSYVVRLETDGKVDARRITLVR